MVDCLADVTPARGRAFIRRVETEDRYQGGSIIIPDHIRDGVAKLQFIVVSVGRWEICEDEDCTRVHPYIAPLLDDGSIDEGDFHSCSFDTGDWVLARNRSWMQTPDPDVFVIRQSDILGVFVEG